MAPCHLAHEERIKAAARAAIEGDTVLVIALFADIHVSIATRRVRAYCRFSPHMHTKTRNMCTKVSDVCTAK